MTTAAFIVHIASPDLTRLPETAEAIHDACESAGLAVESVVPWAHPTISPLSIEDQFLSGGLSLPPPGFMGEPSQNLGA